MQTQAAAEEPGTQTDQGEDKPADKQTDRNQNRGEDTTRTRISAKRPAEEEADDSGRGDRSDWRNFVEPSSSSQAPSQPTPNVEERSIGTPEGQVRVICDVASPMPTVSGGTKRPQENHATMDYDGAEMETKTQRISSICFGIGSEDISGEMSAFEYDEELKEMASEYKAAVEDGLCFVHIRATRSSNKDLRMLSQLTHYRQFKRVNL